MEGREHLQNCLPGLMSDHEVVLVVSLPHLHITMAAFLSPSRYDSKLIRLGVFKNIRIRKFDPKNPKSDPKVSEIPDIRNFGYPSSIEGRVLLGSLEPRTNELNKCRARDGCAYGTI
ncbi:hypothetical protein LXL04_029929 [Taraxacum kok-saghyz]